MVSLIGIILLALGLSLAVVWKTSVMDVLMGVIPLSLIVWDALALLIGYSEVKARREYRKAVSEENPEAAPCATTRYARRGCAHDPASNAATPNSSVSTSGQSQGSTPQPSPTNHSTP